MARKTHPVVRGIVIALGVLVLAFILLTLLVPKDAIREHILAKLEEEAGRPIAVAAVHVGLFPSPHVELSGVEIGEAPAGPRLRFSLRSLTLQTRLIPLLQRRVEIVRVEVDQPVLEVFLAEPPVSGGARSDGDL
ncbi:MAG: AsmA family protein, partial [Candidatus Eisenbacteria sp.]|nr:AsmA family protein [Candidatus Eisenbacteria bacterium]